MSTIIDFDSWQERRMADDTLVMTGEEFKAALKALAHTQLSFANRYAFGKRTIATWADRGPPDYAVAILRDLFENRVLPPAELQDNSNDEIDRAFVQAFARVARDGERVGHSPAEIADAADRFFAKYREASQYRDNLLKPALKMAK